MFIFHKKNKASINPKAVVFLGVSLIISLFISTILTVPTQAKMTADNTPTDRAKSYSYYNAVSKCVYDHMRSTIKTQAGDSGSTSPTVSGSGGAVGTSKGEWFDDLSAYVSVFPDGKLDCGQVTQKAISLWGWGNGKDLLQAMGYKFNSNTNEWVLNTADKSTRQNAFKSAISKQVGDVYALLDNAAKYQLYLGAFTSPDTTLSQCKGTRVSLLSSAEESIKSAANSNGTINGTTYAKISIIEGGKSNEYVYSYSKDSLLTDENGVTAANSTNYGSVWNYRGNPNSSGSNGEGYSCEELATRKIPENFVGFALWVRDHIGQNINDQSSDLSNSSGNCTGSGCDESTAKSNCVIEGVGWIVCPITYFMANLSDSAFTYIEQFLSIKPVLFSTNSGTYQAWLVFLNIANVAFVIAFLMIIFSQLSGQGISNYGIKKTLPRIVITALLVNISFYICQFAVDVTQIMGVSIIDLLEKIIPGNASQQNLNWTMVVGDILAGGGVFLVATGAISIAIIYAALAVGLPVLIAVCLAALMTIIILVARQAGVVILIILSPLAFVAYLLPNTESWFKKWYKMFFGLLMVFPTISLLYGGGNLVSRILSNVANSSGGDVSDKFWLSIVALGVAALPLLMTPYLLKNAMKSTGAIGAKLSGYATKQNNKVGSAVESSRVGEVKQGLKNRFAQERAKRRINNPISSRVDNSRIGQALGLNRGAARAQAVVNKEIETDIADAVQGIYSSKPRDADEFEHIKSEFLTASKKGDIIRARAAQKILLEKGGAGRGALEEAYADDKTFEVIKGNPGLSDALRADLNSANLKATSIPLAKFASSGIKNNSVSSFSEYVNNAENYKGLSAAELSGQSVPNLEAAQKSGGIDKAMAESIVNDKLIFNNINKEKQKIFNEIAEIPKNTNSTTGNSTPASGAYSGKKANIGMPTVRPTTGTSGFNGSTAGSTSGPTSGPSNSPSTPNGSSGSGSSNNSPNTGNPAPSSPTNSSSSTSNTRPTNSTNYSNQGSGFGTTNSSQQANNFSRASQSTNQTSSQSPLASLGKVKPNTSASNPSPNSTNPPSQTPTYRPNPSDRIFTVNTAGTVDGSSLIISHDNENDSDNDNDNNGSDTDNNKPTPPPTT